jgi:hypothetical protein
VPGEPLAAGELPVPGEMSMSGPVHRAAGRLLTILTRS